MSTLRISGIPRTTTAENLSNTARVARDCISLAANDSDRDSPLTGTVTFETKRAADKFLARKRRQKCLGKRPHMDADFLGLTVLSSSAHDEVDIVAVHGLNGHAFQTWAEGDRMWLRDFLPAQFPKARIMTYGYNSDVWDKSSTTTIPEFAQGLLGALLNKRGLRDKKRPIIFICHSLGGIVVKLALNIARMEKGSAIISTATHGIIFFATPHYGSDTASNALLGLAAKTLGVREDLFLALKMGSSQLNEIDKDFRLHHGGLELATFYETKKTKIARIISTFDHVIVDRASALLNVGDGARYPMERDHKQICKFGSKHDDDYKAVCSQVERMVKGAPGTVKTRIIRKALLMPQISAMIRLGGESLRGYSEAWADDYAAKGVW